MDLEDVSLVVQRERKQYKNVQNSQRKVRSSKFYSAFLSLVGLNIHDGGEYSCEIETDRDQPVAMVHTVEILGQYVVNYVPYLVCFLSQIPFVRVWMDDKLGLESKHLQRQIHSLIEFDF